MELLSIYGIVLAGIAHLVALFTIALIPAWWLAGRFQDAGTPPFFRFLCAVGLALVGYLTSVNLMGRLVGQSTIPAGLYLAASGVGAFVLWQRRPTEMSFGPLLSSWKEWAGLVLLALVLGLPQWIAAVSTPYWDEVATSAIHLTAPNQFAEGVFPPRHNALPDIPIKYHYGFTILSGTVRWLTGLPATNAVDVASTALWLFAFLFVVYWLRSLAFSRATAVWGGFSALIGGGLSWLYLRSLEAYSGFDVSPPQSQLLHRYDGGKSLLDNLVGVAQVPSFHLRNSDGTISNLPWDIAAQFQQHAVAMGIALTVFALYVFVAWQRSTVRRRELTGVAILTFALVPLGHAVFGGVAAVTAGVVLGILWLRDRSRQRFLEGAIFTAGVAVIALLHGGFFATGAEYGVSADVFTLRHGFGYFRGGASGFLNWNLAGFGVPFLLALVAWGALAWEAFNRSRSGTVRRPLAASELAFLVLSVFTLFSYFLPQFAFYSSESSGIEQGTEISKFFFTARLGLALVSTYGAAWLLSRVHWAALLPLGAAAAITPLIFVYAHSTAAGDSGRAWTGFYRAPYFAASIEQQMGETFRHLKHSTRDVYFDASADERVHGYLNEMLFFGGSAFTLTPSAYERTGVGYRLSQDVVSRRYIQNSRMARLRPGAAEDCQCRWFYSRPSRDFAFAPIVVRSRFAKLVDRGYVLAKLTAGQRVLFAIEKSTADLDQDIHLYWRPRVVSQTHADRDGDGRNDLIFYDYADRLIRISPHAHPMEAPPAAQEELAQLYVGRFSGHTGLDFVFGRTMDTEFKFGQSVMEVVERSTWGWSSSQSSGGWEPETRFWDWDHDGDIPLVADLDHDGYDTHLMFRPRTGEWFDRSAKLGGPAMEAKELPVPFAGRFLPGSMGDLALWSRATGALKVQSLSNGSKAELKWEGQADDVFVPGDYNGDGYDELATWRRADQTWRWRVTPDGGENTLRFGTSTGIPIPADYNHDGRVDFAYWEPRENKIFVTFSAGRAVDLVVPVPPHSVPGFVNMQ